MREESILIVEDNEDLRGLVRIALEQYCSRTSQHARPPAPVLMVPR